MCEDRLDQVGGCIEHMLAVVNTNSRTLPSSAAATDSATVLPGSCAMPNTAATASGTAAGISDRGEFENPHPVGELIGQPGRDFHGEACFANSTHTSERHHPMFPHRRLDLVDLGLASDQARGRGPQISRRHVQCPQRRKVRLQALCSHLKHPDRNRDIAQPSRPQIDEVHPADSPAVESANRI